MNLATPPDYVVVADPQSLRWQHYRRDLDRYWNQMRSRPQLHLLPWAEVIERDGDLSEMVPAATCLLRIESPARNVSLFRLLMRAGEMDRGEEPSPWPTDEGWIASPRRLYAGFCRILRNIESSTAGNPRVHATSSLADTRTLFDKNAVSRILSEQAIETPDAFEPESIENLFGELSARDWQRAYVKLAYGSCASGIAFLTARGQASSAVTTVAEINGRFYNTYNVRRVVRAQLHSILKFLVHEVATVQRPIDKARVAGDPFDLRAVVIGGEVVAGVFRASKFPMTNLHLGGYRADHGQCRRAITDRAWADAMDVCWRAAQRFDMAALGIDLAFDRHTMQPQVIEINAFGDFFPNWTDDRGRTIHQIEIAATAARFG